jgi:hypothetical protein
MLSLAPNKIYNTMIKSGVYTQSEGKLKYEMEANKVSLLMLLVYIPLSKTVT